MAGLFLMALRRHENVRRSCARPHALMLLLSLQSHPWSLLSSSRLTMFPAAAAEQLSGAILQLVNLLHPQLAPSFHAIPADAFTAMALSFKCSSTGVGRGPVPCSSCHSFKLSAHTHELFILKISGVGARPLSGQH